MQLPLMVQIAQHSVKYGSLRDKTSFKAEYIFLATLVPRCHQSYHATYKYLIHKLEIIS